MPTRLLHPATIVFSLSLLQGLAAQTQPATVIGATTEDATVRRDSRTWPTTLPAGQFRHCIAATITNYGLPDAVILSGTTPLLAVAPGIHGSMGYLPLYGPGTGSTNDLAVLVGAGDSPTRDALALVGTWGLRILKQDSNGNFTTTLLQAGPWQSAQLIAAHPDDPNTIFGVAANSSTILVATQSPSHAWSTMSFELSSPARAIEAVRWNADTVAELAVLTNSGVTIFNRNGTPASSLFAGAPVSPATRSMARVRYAGGEVVAWLKSDPTGGADLYVCGAAASDSLWDLGGADFVALASRDWSLDGQDDLFLSRRTGGETTILVNAAPIVPCMFGNTFGFRLPQANTPASSNTPVAVRDFDGDGDGDLFAVGISAPGVGINQLVSTKAYDHPGLDLTVEPVDEASSIVHISSYAPTYTNVGVAPPTVIANGFELYVWPCAFGANAGDLTMTATPVIHRTEPLGANMDFRLDVPAAAARLPGVFAILMRPIRTTGSTIVPAGNPHMGLLLTSTAGADWVLPEDGVPVPAITPKPALPPKPF